MPPGGKFNLWNCTSFSISHTFGEILFHPSLSQSLGSLYAQQMVVACPPIVVITTHFVFQGDETTLEIHQNKKIASKCFSIVCLLSGHWHGTRLVRTLLLLSFQLQTHIQFLSQIVCVFPPQILTEPFELRWWALYIESLRGAKHEIEICQKFWRSVCNSCGFAASIFAFRKMLNNPTEKNSLLRRKGGGVLTSIWSCLMIRHLGSHPK